MFDDRYDAYDSAVFVKAGSRLMINLHYTANGSPRRTGSDTPSRCSRETENQFRFLPDMGAPRNGFILPPGEPNITGESHILLTQDVALLSMHPHMHLRGKDWNLTATYPDGRKELLLNVPNYNFEWQLDYYPDKPVVLPAGTRIDVVGRWDNSAGNKFNPDPTAAVAMGQQNWEEMWNSLIGVAVPRMLIRERSRRKQSRQAPRNDSGGYDREGGSVFHFHSPGRGDGLCRPGVTPDLDGQVTDTVCSKHPTPAGTGPRGVAARKQCTLTCVKNHADFALLINQKLYEISNAKELLPLLENTLERMSKSPAWRMERQLL